MSGEQTVESIRGSQRQSRSSWQQWERAWVSILLDGMTAAESIEFYKHGLQFEFSANKRGPVICGSGAVRTALAAAGSNSRSKSTDLGKGNTIRQIGKGGLAGRRNFASASVALSESVMSAPQAPVSAKARLCATRMHPLHCLQYALMHTCWPVPMTFACYIVISLSTWGCPVEPQASSQHKPCAHAFAYGYRIDPPQPVPACLPARFCMRHQWVDAGPSS